jgi:putative ABC transport system permease protein
MSGPLYLAWRYLAFHRWKTAVLVTALSLILFIPVGLRVLVRQSSEQLTARAEATPLLVGAPGSPTELVLNSLYFGSDVPTTLSFAEADAVAATGLATPIPLYVRFRVRDQPIVGTTPEYFSLRGLRVAAGRLPATLGEAVLGAAAARTLDVGVGGHVISSPESVFDIAGVYPLRMKVTGILTPSDTPDDQAVFVDVKSAWVIEGLGHGHQDLSRPEAAAGVLSREGNVVIGNAAVVQYNEITSENIDSFHFHGDPGAFPVTAVIAVPDDAKASALLRGRYQESTSVQIVRPDEVMSDLLGTVFTVERYVLAGALIVGLATLATALLVFLLSLRQRQGERETLSRIGGSPGSIRFLMASEIFLVLLVAIGIAGLLTLLASRYGSSAARAIAGL